MNSLDVDIVGIKRIISGIVLMHREIQNYWLTDKKHMFNNFTM